MKNDEKDIEGDEALRGPLNITVSANSAKEYLGHRAH